MDEFLNKNRVGIENEQSPNQIQIEKQISNNDIRAQHTSYTKSYFGTTRRRYL